MNRDAYQDLLVGCPADSLHRQRAVGQKSFPKNNKTLGLQPTVSRYSESFAIRCYKTTARRLMLTARGLALLV